MPISIPTPPRGSLVSHLYDLKSLKNLTRTRQHPLVKECLSIEKQIEFDAKPSLSTFIADVARGFKLCFPHYSTIEFDTKKYIEIFSTPEHNLAGMENKPATFLERDGRFYIQVEGPQNTALLPRGKSSIIVAAVDAFVSSGIPVSDMGFKKIAASQGLFAGTQQLFMQKKGIISNLPIVLDANSVKEIRYLKDDEANCALASMELFYTFKPHPSTVPPKNGNAFYYKNSKMKEAEEIIDEGLYNAIADAIREQMVSSSLSANNNILKIKYKGKILEIEPLVSVQSVIDLSTQTSTIDLQTQINIHQSNIKIIDGLFDPDWVAVFSFSSLPNTVNAYQWRPQEIMTPEEMQMQRMNFMSLQKKVNEKEPLSLEEQIAYDKLNERFQSLVTDCARGFQLCLPCSEQEFVEFEAQGVRQRFDLQDPQKNIEIPEEDLSSTMAITDYFVNQGMPLSSSALLKVGRSQGLLALPMDPLQIGLRYAEQALTPMGSIKHMSLSKYEYIEENAPECEFNAIQFFYYLTDSQGNVYYKDEEVSTLQKIDNLDPFVSLIKNSIAEVNASKDKKERYFFTGDTLLSLKAATEQNPEALKNIEPILCMRTHIEFGKTNDPTTDYTIEYDLFQSGLKIEDPRLFQIISANRAQTSLRSMPAALMNAGSLAATNIASSVWERVPTFRSKPESKSEFKADLEHKHEEVRESQSPTFTGFTALPQAVSSYLLSSEDTLLEKELPMQTTDFSELQLKVAQNQSLTTEETMAYAQFNIKIEQIIADCVRNWNLCLPSSKQNFVDIDVIGVSQRFALMGEEKRIVIPVPKTKEIVTAVVNYFVKNGIPLSASQILKVGNSQGLLARPNEPVFLHLKQAGQLVTASSTMQDVRISKYENVLTNTSECQVDSTQFFYVFNKEDSIYYQDAKKGLQEIDQEGPVFKSLHDTITKMDSTSTEHQNYFANQDKKLILELEQEGTGVRLPVATAQPLLCVRTHIELAKKNDPHQNADPTIYYTVMYDLLQPGFTIDDPQLSPVVTHGIGRLSAALRSSIPTVPTVAGNVASTVWSYMPSRPSFRKKTEEKSAPIVDAQPPVTMHIVDETKGGEQPEASSFPKPKDKQ